MHALLARVETAIRRRGLIAPGQGVLVAVSGGVDSMVLLDALHALAPTRGWRLVVAHFNHRLRGVSSGRDAQFVQRAARRLGLECVVEAGEVRAHARERGWSIEMAARELRHEFLARTARQRGLDVVALAHHADDQVELFFLRLFRGAGSGLAGMKWSGVSPADAAVKLVRPLLEQPKAALVEFADATGIKFREDASNTSADILRNRIRHELLPRLRKSYQPAVAQTVLRTMEIVDSEAAFVRAEAEQWLRRRAKGFEVLPVALQRQCLCVQLEQLGLPAEFDLVEQLRGQPGVRHSCGAGWLVRESDTGKVRRVEVESMAATDAVVDVKLEAGRGKVVFEGVEFQWRTGPRGRAVVVRPVAGRERFDAEAVGPSVRLRHWRPGDRFRPSGFPVAAKLQDLFTNAKVPSAERHRRLVAETSAGQIFWVEGLRIGEEFKLAPETRRQLEWRWVRAEGGFQAR
ncbi:MAG: tRNA lysidine(34) synthetase TilS [Pedosphaera sp. Tous-C6FEB]|nr:MAG: tRNA lysidine(34) synthetase TilS [Pedosphaera sp. Tous-C6FEB]